MRRLILLLVLLKGVLVVSAQSYRGVKVYAYRQPVVSGVSPKGIVDESGKEVNTRPKQRSNTWIYVSFPSEANLLPTEVYINGVKHEVKIDKITSTPVTFSSSNILDKSVKELVPKTTNKVRVLTPLQSVTFTPSSSCLRKKIAKNNVVVGFTVNNKKYYSSQKEIIMLEPAVMQ